MYRKIMIPLDLVHHAAQGKAIATAVELARIWKAQLVFVGVTANTPGALAHSPEEYSEKLTEFAANYSKDIATSAHAVVSHDPAVDLDSTLLKAVQKTAADLVVMQTHHHRVTDWIWPSNGGTLATHADCSVMLVRD